MSSDGIDLSPVGSLRVFCRLAGWGAAAAARVLRFAPLAPAGLLFFEETSSGTGSCLKSVGYGLEGIVRGRRTGAAAAELPTISD